MNFAERTPAFLGSANEREATMQMRRKHQSDERDAANRKRQDKALDDALKNTFPASDPISIEQPEGDPAADREAEQ